MWQYRISGIFGGYFDLAVWQFFLNHQTKVTANTILRRRCESINGNPGQSTKLNVCQSAFAAKSPNLMPAKCTTPTVYCSNLLQSNMQCGADLYCCIPLS